MGSCQALTTLQKYFDYESFRPGQLPIIQAILNKQDVLAILPTGGGKSICFQIPGLILPGTTLVISPLISLMQDQVQALKKRGIKACFLNSSLSKAEFNQRLKKLKKQAYKFVYVAPERLQSQQFKQVCQQIKISLIAIDEAHCISMWGHDFRPSYRLIIQFVNQLKPQPNIAAFTATATPQVQTDINDALQLNQPQIFIQSFQRKNLHLNIIKAKTRGFKQVCLLKLLKIHYNQPGIIYCATRHATQQLAQLINRLNFHQVLTQTQVKAYHGGLSNQQRKKVQDQFLKNKTKIICATNAFGMGVDKPDIRFVIHYQIPGNLENYYQEAGRGGRDQQPAHCYLLFFEPDLKIQLGLIKNSKPNRFQIRLTKLITMLNWAKLGTNSHSNQSCLEAKILEYFSGQDHVKHHCNRCQNCNHWSLQLTHQEKKFCQQLGQVSSQLSWQSLALAGLLECQSWSQLAQIPGINQQLIDKLDTNPESQNLFADNNL